MKVSELQSLMAHNRVHIRKLEVEAANWKKYRKQYAEHGDTNSEYYCHDYLQITKKKIAKLVSLQKSLKREIREKVEMASERNALNRYYAMLQSKIIKRLGNSE